ncbi:hypothetical protein PIROE2DRAFT_20387 [Piromyces sp. E2]|nr:hypothetical protein PIROE2DRAFT_20387 [Piromyces sp. E2]|eukprot:OUM65133.1 hypothetical protein PIROE2DRAFT_20387 [Piromyces sp. E2]
MVNLIFNPYNSFRDISTSEYFVDKTELILEINKVINSLNNANFICMSLPENFNKSIITNMLIAYYEYSEKESIIFNGTKLSKIKTQSHDNDVNNKTEEWKKYLNKFNVIKLNMKKYFLNSSIKKGLKRILKNIIKEVKNSNKNFEFQDENELTYILEDIYTISNRKIVLIINEWDSVIQDKKDNIFFQEYHNFLESLINNNECLALTFMTGILPINYYYENSNLSYVFEDFSMISPKWMAKYVGYTDKEVKELCEKYLNNKVENNSSKIPIKRRKLNEEDKKSSLHEINNDKINTEELIYKKEAKHFYNGYQLFDTNSNKKYEIYSPNSINEALKKNNIKNDQMKNNIDFKYFKNTIQNNYIFIKDVIPLLKNMEKVSIDSLNYQNDMNSFNKRKKILFKLVLLGYLGYDTENIFIPNKEIQEIFEAFLTPELINKLNESKLLTLFNPGEREFKKFAKTPYFVDKTELILELNNIMDDKTILNNVCITRPRRFGKTVVVEMITAYYSYSESKITVFDKKAITKNKNWDKYLGKFNVIQLNMFNYFSNDKTLNEGINEIKKDIIECVKKTIPDFQCNYEKNINKIINEIYENTGRKIVLIIDEWDYILRKHEDDMETHISYMDFLALFIKDKERIALTYMTEILPIKEYKRNSSIKGIFWEFTMTSPSNIAKYVGFTDEEVKMLCDKYKHLSDSNKEKINNYKNKLRKRKKENDELIKHIENYWNNTETFRLLSDYINMDFFELKEDILYLMDDKNNELKINIENYQNNTMEINSKDDVLTHLVHLGYLAYNSKNGTVYIPNKEVHKQFESYLLNATLNRNENKVAEILEKIHNQYSNKDYNNETTLSATIRYAYIYANVYYTILNEVDSGCGYADVFLIPYNSNNYPAYVIELKYNKTAETGINQIKKKKISRLFIEICKNFVFNFNQLR